MKNILIKVNEVLNKYKKKIIVVGITMTVAITLLGTIGGYYAYGKIKSNIKYTQEQCEKIALSRVPGEVVKVKKELDDGALEYEFKIKDKNNMLQEVNVNATLGAITEVECEDDDSHYHKEHNHNNINQNTNVNNSI